MDTKAAIICASILAYPLWEIDISGKTISVEVHHENSYQVRVLKKMGFNIQYSKFTLDIRSERDVERYYNILTGPTVKRLSDVEKNDDIEVKDNNQKELF